MSETFNYTEAVDPVTGAGGKPSEAISSIYYNEKTKELLVGLVESGRSYVYTGVPRHVFTAFKTAVSKGYFYSKIVKNQYGPGENLGWSDDVEFVDLNDNVYPLSFRAGAAGTPKGLTTNDKTTTSAPAFATPAPVKQEVKFDDAKSTTVVFNMGGNDATTDFNDKTTVSEAVAEISRIADMLGLGSVLVIKSVTVNFE